MARVLYLVLALLVLVAGLAFHVRNKQFIALDYFAGRVSVELSLVVVTALVAGVALGALALASVVLRCKRELRRVKRRHRIAERELENLRATALKDVA